MVVSMLGVQSSAGRLTSRAHDKQSSPPDTVTTTNAFVSRQARWPWRSGRQRSTFRPMSRMAAVLVVGLVVAAPSACVEACKSCVPTTRVHLTSSDGGPLAPRSVDVTDNTGLTQKYECLDGGAAAQCFADGVSYTGSEGELTIVAAALSGETGATSVKPALAKTGDGACGPCLSADVTLVLQ